METWDNLSKLPQRFGMDVWGVRYKLWITFFSPPQHTVYPGEYTVHSGATLRAVAEMVSTKSQKQTVTVTILPGWNIFDVDAVFAAKGISKSGDVITPTSDVMQKLRANYSFLNGKTSLEGFLYPDTYDIDPKKGLLVALSTVLSNFQKKVPQAGDTDFYATLILSSIVEKEERNNTNKPIVAGILKNRLQNNIALGADATVCYGFSLLSNECKPSFIATHVHTKTSYNTRTTVGLPPTPICNPTASTITATKNSAVTSYMYYLHGTDRTIHYAKTLEEHNANIQKYE